MPGSHFLKFVIIRTLSSRQPNSLAKVSAAATDTAAPNIHKPNSHSSRRNAPVAISAGMPPFANTFTQPRWPSSLSDIFLAFFSSNFHFVAKCENTKNARSVSNHVQCPNSPTSNPTNTAAATPAVSRTLAFVEAMTRATITIEVIIRLP